MKVGWWSATPAETTIARLEETPSKHWSNFRQSPKTSAETRAAGGRPGRSRWPEPDSIRRHKRRSRTRTSSPRHACQAGQYPRAAFGLPIVFHFKDSGRGDPRRMGGKSLTLAPTDTVDARQRPVRRDRMASPLILRPYFDGKQYRPLALLLPGWSESK